MKLYKKVVERIKYEIWGVKVISEGLQELNEWSALKTNLMIVFVCLPLGIAKAIVNKFHGISIKQTAESGWRSA